MSMCNSIFNHAPDVNVSVIREFRGEYLLVIAVVPQVATLPPGELKGWPEGIVDQAGYLNFLLLHVGTVGSCIQTIIANRLSKGK